MGIMKSLSVIFDSVVTYLCYLNKGYFVDIEEKTLPRKFNVIDKDIEIYGSGIVEYSVRSEIGHMITIRDHTYYFTGLTKDVYIFSPKMHIRRI